jgi:hypothetical protein
VHGERGQATVEWVALALLVALVLTGAAALASREADPELGRLVAKRIVRVPERTAPAADGGARAPAPLAAAAPPPLVPRSLDAFPRLRGLDQVARHAWIACIGYRRWRHELVYPRLPIEPLPLRAALDIANDCLNPYDYLVED